MQFEVCKASGRLRVGQIVECGAGAAIDGSSQVPGRLLTGVPGALKYFARFLPVPKVHAESTAKALSVLGHPNVVAPIGVGIHDGLAFIVQELPEGELLARMIQRAQSSGERIKLRDVEQVFRQAATALRHAHQAQIRHGSLGSSQVRVARQSAGDVNVQVVDFGMLPLLATHAPSVSVHEWQQLSPEQAAQPSNASVASDLFSLGVLLIELLTGHSFVPPAAKMPWRELSLAKPNEVRATVARERPETPTQVLDLVASLLRARPEDRTPASAMDLTRLLPRLSWEPRSAPSPAESAPRAAARGEGTPPAEVPRAATMAPSRSFVVAGSSQPRPVPATTPLAATSAAPPSAGPEPSPPPVRQSASSTPSSVVDFDDDATLSEVPPSMSFSDPTPAPSPRSWFVSEETVLTTQPSQQEAPLEEGTRIVAVPERRAAVAAVARGFFHHEGTAVLAHPDQLAAPRGDVSSWDIADGVDAPASTPFEASNQETTQPVPREQLAAMSSRSGAMQDAAITAPRSAPEAPFQLPSVESTMPDLAMPDPLRAALSTRLPPRAADHRAIAPTPNSPSTEHDDPDGVPPALLVLIVVAGGTVLGLVLWGFLHS